MNSEKTPAFLENLCASALSPGLTRLIHPENLHGSWNTCKSKNV